jgi:hypothetical protein
MTPLRGPVNLNEVPGFRVENCPFGGIEEGIEEMTNFSATPNPHDMKRRGRCHQPIPQTTTSPPLRLERGEGRGEVSNRWHWPAAPGLIGPD